MKIISAVRNAVKKTRINFAKFSFFENMHEKLGLSEDAKLKKTGYGTSRVQMFHILRLTIKIFAVLSYQCTLSRPYNNNKQHLGLKPL